MLNASIMIEWCNNHFWCSVALGYALLLVLSFIYEAVKPSRINLKGKHVFITGGSSGLGLSIAVNCAKQHAKTITIVARNEAKLKTAQEFIEKSFSSPSQQRVLTISASVTKFEDIQKAVQHSEKFHGSAVDLLICNAGYSVPGYTDDLSSGVFEEQMSTNYLGCVNTVKAALPSMKRQFSGHIVLVSSALAYMGFIGYGAYIPSKFAVRAFGDCLRNELLKYNIKVSQFFPSTMDTPGLLEENKTKPKETAYIESLGSINKPDVSAATMFNGLAKGYYAITEDFLIELCRLSSSTLTPRNNVLLELLLLPVALIVGMLFRMYLDYLVKPEKPKNESKQTLKKLE